MVFAFMGVANGATFLVKLGIIESMDLTLLQNYRNQAISGILDAQTERGLEEIRISYLGRKGEITLLLKEIPQLPKEVRGEYGRQVNEAKRTIEEALTERRSQLQKEKTTSEKDWLDVTAPGILPPIGHLHLISQTIREITQIFKKLGFDRVAYPEVEWDWYAFEGLNMPKNHPARDEWETFFVDSLSSKKYGRGLLTPHTSSGQLREMENNKPPIRMLNIAKCYRRQMDVSHAPMFYQFEGLVIDKNVSATHLKGTLDYFAREFFGPDRKTRIRPFHFQFTEPSFEVDVTCAVCKGKGCQVCKEGWLELGGAGMVHPSVLKNGGIDPNEYSGFAFGWGVERVLMMRYGLDDIRLLFSGNPKFLDQF